ncbi:MAG: RNA polymerase sigma factor RpoD, partial [Burkholderiales bacterium 21-58-4]
MAKADKTAVASEPKKLSKTAVRAIPSGRRPGRPAKNANNDRPDFDDDADGEAEVIPDLKPLPKRGGKRAKADKDAPARSQMTPEEQEARRNRLKVLIKLGKDRGYLTYGEINDHLPDDLVDAEAIDGIISTFSDMGIAVYDQAPDAETLLLSDNAPVASSDDDVEDEAEAALTTVDSDFGRTTDPVRMYMREMGTVELLTREGEIEIAKRIEDGLKHMIQAISACPTTIQEILALVDKVEREEIRIDDFVDGVVAEEIEEMADEPETDDSETEENDDEVDDDAEEDDGSALAAANLAQLKIDAMAHFEVIRKIFKRIHASSKKNGFGNPQYLLLQEELSAELMNIRFSAKQVEALCDGVRHLVEEIRSHERDIMEFAVHKSGMPRAHFIKVFPGNESNLDWVTKEINSKKAY